jgi:tripartite-type tricarboxylate transporter receptor subunit TctC
MNGLPFVKFLQTTLRHCASAMVMLGAISFAAQAQTPEQFARFVAADVDSWRSAVKNTGIKAD